MVKTVAEDMDSFLLKNDENTLKDVGVEEMRRIIPRLLVFLDHDVTPCRKGLDFIHCCYFFITSPREKLRSVVMSTSVCLSVCPQAHVRSLPNFICMLPMALAKSSSGRVTKSQCEGAVLGFFFPTDSALYSIAFGTHTKNG